MNVRDEALKILYEIEYDGAYSNIALKNGLCGFDARDKAFAARVVYGVISRKITLDYIIAENSSLKLNKISKRNLLILRMGVYQLLYMDKVPESAAVNESVKLARKYNKNRSAAGFVNAVLRSAARMGGEYPLPEDNIKMLSVKFSFPESLVETFVSEFGETFAAELMEAMNATPAMCVRANALKTTRDELIERLTEDGAKAERGMHDANAVTVAGLNVESSPLYKSGAFTVQDEAAMCAARMLDVHAGMHVMDLCAAPGGKTTYLAELMQNSGVIDAFDIHEHKTELIRKNAERLGISIIKTHTADTSMYMPEYAETADRVLCDVPCSGSGVIRRKPEIKYNNTDPASFTDVQYAVLENAARYVKAGGVIVYCTCSVHKCENDEIIDKFLQEHKEFTPGEIGEGENGRVTFYPNVHGTDGFFAAKLVKINGNGGNIGCD